MKVQVGNDQEKAKSDRNSHSKTELGKTKLKKVQVGKDQEKAQ